MAAPLDAFPDVDDEAARDLVGRHQAFVRDLPDVGVDGLVYEYRTQFHRDPLATQDGTAYYLSVRDHVWDEFADRMGLSDDELATLKDAHAAQFAAHVGDEAGDEADDEAMILTKE
ncbi:MULTISPECIES: hypothetical protein [Halorussus]|uniref:hypothetical protein n=1 Tax=Halorussus TaxID=1070314 RepID=UPI000E20F9A2|nr:MULTISPECIES: hypothetical protein [Halorussus]NHN61250.1 hypothetical protein [Halorussus sp. JP-T4]